MKPLPLYRHKDTVFHGLHPAIAATVVFSLLALILLLRHPVYLCLAGAGVWSLVVLADVARETGPHLRLGLFMALLVVMVNPLVNHRGEHVLVYGPHVPLLGKLDITLESLVYGSVSAFRLLLVMMVFGLASTAISPDGLLDILARISSRSSLSAAIAIRLYPSMVVEAREMKEVQLVRGERLQGGAWQRMRAHLPFLAALFQGLLDRAACIAESMSARGFGSGKATRRRTPFRARDPFFGVFSLAGVAVVVLMSVLGKGDYDYFPTLSNPLRGLEAWAVAALCGEFACLAIIGWSWKRWPWLRSRM